MTRRTNVWADKRNARLKDVAMWLNLTIYLLLCVGICTAVNIQYEPGMLDQFMKQSNKQCVDICNTDIKCVWSKYYYRLKLCMIYGTNASVFDAEPDTYLHKKPELVLEHDMLVALDCEASKSTGVVSDTCQAKHCGAPATHLDSEIRGNMYGIGAKVRYNCIDGSKHAISTCEVNGEWTSVTLLCNCSSPTNDDVITYMLTRYNVTHVIGEVSCSDGYRLLQKSQPFCQISSGLWTNVESRCIKKGWMNIFELKAGGDDAIIGSWETDKHASSSYIYRDTMIDSWQDYNISQVRLEVFRNNAVVAFMQFNGVGSTKNNWFSHTRLMNNTWSDLSSTTSVNEFSIYGLSNRRRRFFVSKTSAEICSSKSWFLVTWNTDYDINCNTNMPQTPAKTTVIMYANGTTVSKFQNMEFADAFNVSIIWN